MRVAEVYRNKKPVGLLRELDGDGYEFRYNDDWYNNYQCPAISLTLSKSRQSYHSDQLFPFFFNMLSEGVNRQLQCRQLKIDEDDDFGLLLASASEDTIGAVTIKPVEEL